MRYCTRYDECDEDILGITHSESLSLSNDEDIKTLRSRILEKRKAIEEVLSSRSSDRMPWEEAGLLNGAAKMLLGCLTERNATLTRCLSLSKQELLEKVDLIHETVLLTEVMDEAWTTELRLRHQLDEHVLHARVGEAALAEVKREIFELCAAEASLVEERRNYADQIARESQAILRHRFRFEEVSHHLNVFSTGVEVVMQEKSGGEQMRCSFNELRRVNSSLEEKLVMTGILNQKILSDLSACRASCGPADDESLEEWRSLPFVPSSTGEQTHSDLLTFLAVSCGYFLQECIEDLSEVALGNTRRSKINSSAVSSSRLEQEALLVGVLCLEANRYKRIATWLETAIKDAQTLQEDASVAYVIVNACGTIRTRLSCSNVTLWTSHGVSGSSCTGDTLQLDSSVELNSLFFFRPMTETVRFEGDVPPADLAAVCRLIGNPCAIEAFAVSCNRGGLTVVRNESSDPPFEAFSGIYVDQFYRRIVSAIAPLQQRELERIAAKRPLDLARSIFELRQRASSPSALIALVSQHMHVLFKAENVNIFLCLDRDPQKLIRLSLISTSCVPFFVEKGNSIPEKFQPHAFRFVSLIETPQTINDVLRSNLSLSLGPSDVPKDLKALLPLNREFVTHIRPVFSKPRSPASLIVCWTNQASSNEACFDYEKESHKSILESYTSIVQAMLGAWFGTVCSGMVNGGDLLSLEVEDEMESQVIKKLISVAK